LSQIIKIGVIIKCDGLIKGDSTSSTSLNPKIVKPFGVNSARVMESDLKSVAPSMTDVGAGGGVETVVVGEDDVVGVDDELPPPPQDANKTALVKKPMIFR